MAAPASLADEVVRIGQEAGLDAVGICDAAAFEDTRRILHERRARGLAAGMQFTYRNPERSTHPDVTLPGVAALFVGARRYERRRPAGARGQYPDGQYPDSQDPDGQDPDGRHPDAPTGGDVPAGRVAMYSWVDHYQPLRAALRTVADYLAAAGWQAHPLADDNALVDRAAAVRAGIGWYGKNTNVLLPGSGSWFVLGSVLTDAPLTESRPPPQPVPDGCGPCRRCQAACPTAALDVAGELDARRCLAWLLQAPGSFPRRYRVALGDRLYGCDDCQTACPINQLAARRQPPPAPEPSAEPAVDILPLLAASDEGLMAQVGRWYIPGRQPRYVRRNALIVLGNTADPRHAGTGEALIRALADPDPIVRSHAVWAAARLGRRDLLAGAGTDPDPLVAAEYAAIETVPVVHGARPA